MKDDYEGYDDLDEKRTQQANGSFAKDAGKVLGKAAVGTGKFLGRVLLGVLILAVIAGLVCWSTYNGLIQKDETVRQQWSDIEAQLQRRVDLIPNLVATVKGYAAHEEKIFTEVAAAREKLAGAKEPTDVAEADAALNSALGRLLVITENYPDLKASENFVRLQDELAGTENRIAVARSRYNEAVKVYNAAIRKFPGAFFANMLGLKKADFFEAPAGLEEVQKAPEVTF